MKQKTLLKELFKANVEHDVERAAELKRLQYLKIFAHKLKKKLFGPKWTSVRD